MSFPHSVRHSCVYRPWDKFLYSLFKEVLVLCYQPSWHNCFQFAIVLALTASRFYISAGNRWQLIGNEFPDVITYIVGSFVVKFREMSCYFVTDLRISQTQIQFFFLHPSNGQTNLRDVKETQFSFLIWCKMWYNFYWPFPFSRRIQSNKLGHEKRFLDFG